MRSAAVDQCGRFVSDKFLACEIRRRYIKTEPMIHEMAQIFRGAETIHNMRSMVHGMIWQELRDINYYAFCYSYQLTTNSTKTVYHKKRNIYGGMLVVYGIRKFCSVMVHSHLWIRERIRISSSSRSSTSNMAPPLSLASQQIPRGCYSLSSDNAK